MTDSVNPLDFKGATLYAIRAVIRSQNLDDVLTDLDQRMAQAGSFFKGEPVVLDVSELTAPLDWARLTQAFVLHGLPVIGAVTNEQLANSLIEAGLNSVELSGATPSTTTATQTAAAVVQPVEANTPVPAVDISKPERVAQQPEQAKPTAEPAAAQPTLVVQGPLRSGQRVYARHTDLIVMGVVSQGAEVIADGNIHIYGPLRGKAMAGARGDAQARIFTTCLDAELVAIAGVYRVIDGPLETEVARKPAMINLNGQTLRITSLSA